MLIQNGLDKNIDTFKILFWPPSFEHIGIYKNRKIKKVIHENKPLITKEKSNNLP